MICVAVAEMQLTDVCGGINIAYGAIRFQLVYIRFLLNGKNVGAQPSPHYGRKFRGGKRIVLIRSWFITCLMQR